MSDPRHRPRRTLPVVILDVFIGLAASLQSGHLPRRRRRDDQDPARRGGRRTAMIWTVVAGATVLIGTVSLVVAFLRSPDGLAPLGVGSGASTAGGQPVATGGPAATPGAGADGFGSTAPAVPAHERKTAGPSATPSAPPTGTTVASPTLPSPVPLAARYATTEGGPGLLSYRATITIDNAGGVATKGWQLALTLPRSTLTVAEVSGATVKQDGATWTFSPSSGTATVPPGGSVKVSFQVRGATLVSAAPTNCTIDGRTCTGLSH